jgi:hypothetical protein
LGLATLQFRTPGVVAMLILFDYHADFVCHNLSLARNNHYVIGLQLRPSRCSIASAACGPKLPAK